MACNPAGCCPALPPACPRAPGVSGSQGSRGAQSLPSHPPQEDRGLPAPAGELPLQALLPLQAQAVLHQQGRPQLGPHPQGQGPQEPAEAGEHPVPDDAAGARRVLQRGGRARPRRHPQHLRRGLQQRDLRGDLERLHEPVGRGARASPALPGGGGPEEAGEEAACEEQREVERAPCLHAQGVLPAHQPPPALHPEAGQDPHGDAGGPGGGAAGLLLGHPALRLHGIDGQQLRATPAPRALPVHGPRVCQFGHRRQAPDESEQQAPRLPAPPAPALRLPGPDELMAGAGPPPTRHRNLRSPAPGPAPRSRAVSVPVFITGCFHRGSRAGPADAAGAAGAVGARPPRVEPGLHTGPAALQLAPRPARGSGAVFNHNTAWFYVCTAVSGAWVGDGTPGGAARGNRGITGPWVRVGLRGGHNGNGGPRGQGAQGTMGQGDNEPVAITRPGQQEEAQGTL